MQSLKVLSISLALIAWFGCAPRVVRLDPVHKGWWIGAEGTGGWWSFPVPVTTPFGVADGVEIHGSIGTVNAALERGRLLSYRHIGGFEGRDIYFIRIYDDAERIVDEKVVAFAGEPLVVYDEDGFRVRIRAAPGDS